MNLHCTVRKVCFMDKYKLNSLTRTACIFLLYTISVCGSSCKHAWSHSFLFFSICSLVSHPTLGRLENGKWKLRIQNEAEKERTAWTAEKERTAWTAVHRNGKIRDYWPHLSGQFMVPISPTSLLFCSCAGQVLGETAHKDLLRRDPFRIIKKLGF